MVCKEKSWKMLNKVEDFKNKRKKMYQAESKQKHKCFLERTTTVQDGTYNSGVACDPNGQAPKKKKNCKVKLILEVN